MAEIAALTLSSTKTVRRYLRRFQIPLRKGDKALPPKQAPFGLRWFDGELVPNQKEQQTIERIHSLHANGHPMRDIADILNQLRIPCRKRGARWHVKTVFYCLMRQRRNEG